MKSHAALFLLAVLAGITGCATAPVTREDVAADPARQSIPEYAIWQFRGRVSLVRGEEGWHAGLNWREHDGEYRLHLSGPFGQGALQIDGNSERVRLQTADGQIRVAGSADALVTSVTGWQFPVSGIRYWVRGLAVPELAARISRDADGQLVRLEQSGWDITYSRFQTIDGRPWPTRLRLVADDLSVRMVIDEWSLAAVAGEGEAAAPATDPLP